MRQTSGDELEPGDNEDNAEEDADGVVARGMQPRRNWQQMKVRATSLNDFTMTYGI